MPTKLSLEKAAQVWCKPECSKIVMDTVLANAFAETLDEIWSKPWLGNATTGELIAELAARSNLNYRTVNGETVVNTSHTAP